MTINNLTDALAALDTERGRAERAEAALLTEREARTTAENSLTTERTAHQTTRDQLANVTNERDGLKTQVADANKRAAAIVVQAGIKAPATEKAAAGTEPRKKTRTEMVLEANAAKKAA